MSNPWHFPLINRDIYWTGGGWCRTNQSALAFSIVIFFFLFKPLLVTSGGVLIPLLGRPRQHRVRNR